ncbi:MAG: hypothetical protein J0H99_07150 [Rhodospirillales bacterium]|nr:hypothetical protein [Rhodospirillales bacterium]
MRQMVMVGFLQAQNCTQLASSWRHPEARLDFLDVDYFQHIARVLEAGKFDCGFFETDLVPPDTVRGPPASIVPLRSPSR